MNGCDESSYVELSVNKGFSFGAALSIPNIDPYDDHVGFWRDLDYSEFRSQDNIVENVGILENSLDVS